jgi:RHS repeat-associated protein
LQGNRTKLTDPDAGVITSKYDGWGQLKEEKQKIHAGVDSITTSYNYLSSGFLNYKSRNGETTYYLYDNLYRPVKTWINGKHSQEFTYDQWDRVIQTTDIVDGSKTFVRKTEYDRLGHVAKEIYPSGYTVSNVYDSYGYLIQVNNPQGNAIWQAKESNARGQLTKTQSGDKETTFGFDDRGFPTSILTPDITDLAYSFDAKGNLTYREDNRLYINSHYSEYLEYDNLNRLKTWTPFHRKYGGEYITIQYNNQGNIQKKSDLGNYTMNYGANGKPHALTSISGTPSIMPNNQTITYTDFKKVKTVSEAGNTLTLSYGTDEQRIKTVLTKPNQTLTRYYMGNYEEEIVGGNTRKIHYICGGNGLTAIYVQNAGLDTLYYAHTDYQGSLIALSLADGTVKERYAYDPWGNRRNPNDWSQADTRTSFIVNRGYTMHEHLPEFKLINMNGRVYDPLTAQFFSPDPYLQAPGDWLNYNRYSYAFGNPFKYIDPSGEFLGLLFRGLSFVGQLSSDLIQGRSNPIGHAWGISGQATNGFANCAQIPVYQSDNTRVSIGLDPFALGVSANVVHKTGDNTSSLSVGFGALGGFYANAGTSQKIGDFTLGGGVGVGNNYWGWNASATYQGVGGGYGQTYYGNAIGRHDPQPNPQTVGNITIIWRGGSFTLQNDAYGDKHDRWRSNAAELTIGDLTVGTWLYNNDPKGEAEAMGEIGYDLEGTNRRGQTNRPYKGEQKYGTWNDGKTYASPFYVGYRVGNRIERIGYSSPWVQEFTQNLVHRWVPFGRQNFYVNDTAFSSGIYGYSGYYSPFSLWH